jgi:MFS transporter, OFA family, oxalate/formate antiporter
LTKQNRWTVVFGALLIQVNLGAIFIYSIYKPFLKENFPLWSNTDLALPSQVVLACFALSMIFSGRVQDKKGPRIIATIGGILLGSGVIIASFAKDINVFVIGYSIMGGMGIGAAYVCPLATCLKWFPDKRGFITGLAVGGFGLGAMLFTPIAKYFIQTSGIMSAFLYLGIIFLISVTLGAQFLKIPPENYIPEGYNIDNSLIKTQIRHDHSWKEMLKTYQFKILWFTYFAALTAGLMIIMNVTNIWESFALSDNYIPGNIISAEAYGRIIDKGILAVTIVSVFNALGRIICGKISDRIGRKATLAIIFFFCGMIMLSLNFMNTFFFYVFGVSSVGFCFGGFLALYPAVTADYFGVTNIGTNYGLMYTAYGFGGLLGPYLAPKLMTIIEKIPFESLNKNGNVLINHYNCGSYIYSFIISGIMCIIAALLILTLNPPKQISEL